jgi:protein-S-isoprenylcysteine O-methyltransferase Ste14
MTTGDTPKSAGEMMSDIMGNVGNLVRNEVDLARAEMVTSMTKAGAALGAMALAVILAITGLNVLAASLVAVAIWAGLSPSWATVVVGAGLLVIAGAIFLSAKSALKQVGFMPTRAARSVQRDAMAIKEAYNDK